MRRKRPKTMATLNVVVHDKKETLREYVEHFTRAGVEVQGDHDGLKCFIFERNLRDDCKFKEELGFRAAKDMNDLLTRAQPYINYEEKKLEEEALKNKRSNKARDHMRHNDKHILFRGGFARVRQYNMHLNPEKCTFGFKVGKFWKWNPPPRKNES